MKLKTIHIYGYGKFVDFRIDDLTQLQLIFGENEAGKSTIMSFIHSVLFGFPQRQHSELRYEPKFHSAYGGQIIIESSRYGEVMIERIKGKSSGDVTVKLADGTIGNDELLEKLLAGMDKWMYQSIFSFNLEGLQEVQRLKGEAIGRYLLAAGTVGTDLLVNEEERLQKEAEQLFKPNGRKPKLNELLNSLREQEQVLKKAKQQNNEYESLIRKKNSLLTKIETVNTQANKCKQELLRINELIEKWPMLKESEQIHQRLEKIGHIQFPVDGLTRFEKISDRMHTLSSRMKSLDEKLDDISRKLSIHKDIDEFDLIVEKGDKLVQEWPLFLQNDAEMKEITRKLDECQSRINEISQVLNLSNGKLKLLPEANLGFDIKGRIREELDQSLSLKGKLTGICSQIETIQSDLVYVEKRCTDIEIDLIPEHEFKQMQREIENKQSEAELLREKERLLHLQEIEERKDKQKKKTVIMHAFFGLVSFGLLIWSILTTQWFVTSFALFIFIYLLAITLISYKKDQNNFEQQISEITEVLENKGDKESLLFQQQLQLRNEWKEIYRELEQCKHRLEDHEKQKQDVIRLIEENDNRLNQLKKELGLELDFSNRRLADAYELLSELVSLLEIEKKEKYRLKLKEERHQNWVEKIEELAKQLDLSLLDPRELYVQINMKIKMEKENHLRKRELLLKRQDLLDEHQSLRIELDEYELSLKDLYELAGTENEEDFRKKEREFQEVNDLKARKALLDNQLDEEIIEIASFYSSLNNVEDKQFNLLEEVKEKNESLDQYRHELAAISYKIETLEEGGTYTENLHRFHQLQSTFNEEAKKWAKLVIAKAIIRKTMDQFIKERFPKVIIKAEENLAFLTEKKYKRIYFQDNDQLIVERSDGTIFAPIELSQGTQEILYTAFRFALVHVIHSDYPLPVIVDDGFVNFDKNRTKKVLALLEKMSKDTQILFFSCHEHLCNYFEEKNITLLSEDAHLQKI